MMCKINMMATLFHLQIVYSLLIIKTMPIDRYTFSTSIFHELKSILDHKLCGMSAFL